MYFPNGTSTTVTLGTATASGSTTRGDSLGWPNTDEDDVKPPPCPRPSTDDGVNNNNDNDNDNEDEDENENENEEDSDDDDVFLDFNNDDAPVSAPVTVPSYAVEQPTSPSSPSVPTLATIPAVAEEETPRPSLQPYYSVSPEEEEQEEDDSYLENIVRVAVSIALPPILERGIPKEVGKAVSKLMNITATLRSKEMMDHFLSEYDEDSSAAVIVATLIQLYPVQEIPYIIDGNQELLFYMKYSDTFRRQQLAHAFFWELVNKPTKPIPVRRFPAPSIDTLAPTNLISVNGSTIGENNSSTSTPTVQYASWLIHPVSYRCYERDRDGNVVPILNVSKLSLIESQLHQWLEFHVNTTSEMLMGKLHRNHALGIVMPGDEYDVPLGDDHWTDGPFDLSSSSSSDEDKPEENEEEEIWQVPKGTYTEPLVVEPGIQIETLQERLGWILLVCTTSITVSWAFIAQANRRRQKAQAIWGAHVGTEQALQELLNVGWSIREGVDDRQVLIIYDKTQHGMGYRDEDSMLQGGIPSPPVFITD